MKTQRFGDAAYAAGCTIGALLRGKVDGATMAEVVRMMRILEEIGREEE